MMQRQHDHHRAARDPRRRREQLSDVALGVIVGMVCVAVLVLVAAQAR